MGPHITAAEIEKMKQYLKDYPIDPAWDWECMKRDNHAPWEQQKARIYKRLLQEAGEMEADPPKKNPYPPKEVARMKKYIKDHPIHPELDEAAKTWDISVPIEELTARSFRGILRRIGEWKE